MANVAFYLVFLFAFNIVVLKADCDVASETAASGTIYVPNKKFCLGDLIFEDNFDTFNLKVWNHENTLAGPNGEFEYYLNDRRNSYVENGNLHIKPTYLADDFGEDFLSSGTLELYGGAPADECTNPSNNGCNRTGTADYYIAPIKSARIRTVESFSFKFGTLIVRAKIPGGDWLWPAIWLLPLSNSYGTWPASGEIDLLESRGNKNLVDANGQNYGSHLASQTLHWGPAWYADYYWKTHWEETNDAGFDADFHTYKMVWSSAGISFYVDDQQTGSVDAPDGGFFTYGEFDASINNPWQGSSNMAPFDQEFYIVINLAVGGTNGYFPDDPNNPGGKPWYNYSPTNFRDFWQGKSQWEPTWNLDTDDSHLIIDYVQVYAI